MKAVVVSQRLDHLPDRGEHRDALDDRLAQWLVTAGYLPFPLPSALFAAGALPAWLDHVNPVGLILSGGNDIGDEPQRDATEKALLDHALGKQLPLLGICRGMQMIGVWSGTALRSVANHVRTRHQITGAISGEVNSYHRFALAECPPQFDVLSRSHDGEIEAIRHRQLPWEAWMWHPEREVQFDERDTSRLKALFS